MRAFKNFLFVAVSAMVVVPHHCMAAWGIYEVPNQTRPLSSFDCSGFGPAASEEFLEQYKWDNGEGAWEIYSFTKRSSTAEAGEIVTGDMGEDWTYVAYSEAGGYPVGSYKLKIVEGMTDHNELFSVVDNP
jgi:hypothetical protein